MHEEQQFDSLPLPVSAKKHTHLDGAGVVNVPNRACAPSCQHAHVALIKTILAHPVPLNRVELMCIYIYIYTYICIYMFMRTLLWVYIWYVYMRMHVYGCVYIYIYIYTYIGQNMFKSKSETKFAHAECRHVQAHKRSRRCRRRWPQGGWVFFSQKPVSLRRIPLGNRNRMIV